LDIFTDKESEWLDSLEFINSLNGVEHLEILPEYIPSNKEFNSSLIFKSNTGLLFMRPLWI